MEPETIEVCRNGKVVTISMDEYRADRAELAERAAEDQREIAARRAYDWAHREHIAVMERKRERERAEYARLTQRLSVPEAPSRVPRPVPSPAPTPTISTADEAMRRIREIAASYQSPKVVNKVDKIAELEKRIEELEKRLPPIAEGPSTETRKLNV